MNPPPTNPAPGTPAAGQTTPRTDEALFIAFYGPTTLPAVSADFARQLERELAAANNELYHIRKEQPKQRDYVSKLVEDLEAAKAELATTRQGCATTATLQAQCGAMREALEEITEGKGAFNRDQLIHASNVIDNMKAIARAALAGAVVAPAGVAPEKLVSALAETTKQLKELIVNEHDDASVGIIGWSGLHELVASNEKLLATGHPGVAAGRTDGEGKP